MKSPTHGRFSRRSFLKLSAATATLSTLAACVPAGVAPSGGAGSSPGTESIVINHMSRADFEAQRLAIEAWNQENPDVQIKMDEVVGDTWDYYRIKMMQQLAAGNPPDTVFTDVWYFRMYSTDGVFVNLEPYIEKDADFNKEDLWPVVVENTRSPDTNGEMYCLPYDYGTHALAYNIKLFDELGIPHLDPNKEYDWEMDILPLARELTIDLNGKKSTESDFDPVRIQRYGVNPYNYLFWWYITMAGGQCFDKDYAKSTLNSPEAIDGITFLNDLMNVHKVAPSPAFQQSQPISFQTGNIAMSIVATWDVPGWAATTDFEWDIVRPPRRKVQIGDGRASGFSFLSATKYPEESWQWIKYNSIGHGQDFKQQGGGAIHPIKSKARNDLLMKRTKAPYNMEAFIQEAELGGGPPFFKYWHMYIDMVPAELTPAYNNEITVEEALNKAAEKTDYLLANGKLP